MADIKEEHKHIPFKYGTITWTGAGYPSEEMMQVFNLMADLAVQKCEGKLDSTSEKDLTGMRSYNQNFINLSNTEK